MKEIICFLFYGGGFFLISLFFHEKYGFGSFAVRIGRKFLFNYKKNKKLKIKKEKNMEIKKKERKIKK